MYQPPPVDLLRDSDLIQEYRWLFVLVEFLMTFMVVYPLKFLWAQTLGKTAEKKMDAKICEARVKHEQFGYMIYIYI